MQSFTNKQLIPIRVRLCKLVCRGQGIKMVPCDVFYDFLFQPFTFCNQCAFLCTCNHNWSSTFSCEHSSTDLGFWCSSAGRGGSQSCKLCRSWSHSLQVHSGGLPPQAGAQHASTGKGKETHTHAHRFITVLTCDIACITVSSLL